MKRLKTAELFCTILFAVTLCLSACHLSQTPQSEHQPVLKSAAIEHSGAHWRIPGTGQDKSYAAGDDGDVKAGIARPVQRFTDNGDDTVTDRLTGLMWTKNADQANGTIDWEEAVANSAECKVGEYRDWRLPNRFELESLLDLGQAYPALPEEHPFDNVYSKNYWTSTTPANNEDHAWIVHFFIGFIAHDDKGGTHYVWYVRSNF